MRLVFTLIGLISQIAVGSCCLMSWINAGVISVGNVISTFASDKGEDSRRPIA